jgi:hypothetical protein
MNNTTTSKTATASRGSQPARVDDPAFVDAMSALTANGIGFTVVGTQARRLCELCSHAESLAAA